MSINKNQRIQNSNKFSAEKPKSVVFKKSGFGKVLDIILEDSEKISSAEIGSVVFKSDASQVGNAYPIDRNFLTLPIKNEVVELYQKMFGVTPKNLHNSLNDVIVCLRCFIKLKYEIDIVERSEEVKQMIKDYL